MALKAQYHTVTHTWASSVLPWWTQVYNASRSQGNISECLLHNNSWLAPLILFSPNALWLVKDGFEKQHRNLWCIVRCEMLFNKNNQHSLMTFYIFVNILCMLYYKICKPQGLCGGLSWWKCIYTYRSYEFIWNGQLCSFSQGFRIFYLYFFPVSRRNLKIGWWASHS